jgi:hypothetical protein
MLGPAERSSPIDDFAISETLAVSMPITRPTLPLFGCRTRLVLAGVLAAWIFLLGLAAVSPAWHDALHGETHACASCCGPHHPTREVPPPARDDEHRCAITIFAQGLTTITVITVPPPAGEKPAARPVTVRSREAAHDPDLQPPGRAPPAKLTTVWF